MIGQKVRAVIMVRLRVGAAAVASAVCCHTGDREAGASDYSVGRTAGRGNGQSGANITQLCTARRESHRLARGRVRDHRLAACGVSVPSWDQMPFRDG